MEQQFINVAVDGPAGAGKSTIARRAAAALEFVYVDTGAIYRTLAFAVTDAGIAPDDSAAVAAFLPRLDLRMQWENGVQHMLLADRGVTEEIRRPEISAAASLVSAIPAVRQYLLDTQRRIARTHHVIMDGRDIGTVVLPGAQVKIYLTASAEIRALRRWKELQAAGRPDAYTQVLEEIIERDRRDTQREIAPLRAAEDAVVLDTSGMDLEESVAAMLRLIREKAEG